MSKDFTFFALVAWLVALTVADIYVKYSTVRSIGEKWSYGYVEQDLYYKRTSDNWHNLFDTCQALREEDKYGHVTNH